jgi:disulfide bond formation protein DsbB
MSAVLGDQRPRSARADVHAIWFGLAAALAFAAVGIALVSQHAFDMQPCPWCILQRLIYVVFGIVALVGLVVHRSPVAAATAGIAGFALASCGIAAALWQGHAETSASCNLTLADRIVGATQLDRLIPGVFEARASCADAAVSVLGIAYWTWSAACFALCIALMVAVLRNLRLNA